MATQGTVTFNRDICKGCGLCVTACATHLLVLDESEINRKGYHPVMITDPARCNGCANCALMCPDQGITVTQDRIAREGVVRGGVVREDAARGVVREGAARERGAGRQLVHA
jgi:2-oxoglutarate ferredoxin oxidoreductase subunit delta